MTNIMERPDVIKRKLSIKDILKMLDRPEKVDKLMFSEGAWAWCPVRARRALKEMGIKIEIIKLKRGPRAKVNVDKIKELSFLSPKEIAQKLKIPLRTVYYHLAKMK